MTDLTILVKMVKDGFCKKIPFKYRAKSNKKLQSGVILSIFKIRTSGNWPVKWDTQLSRVDAGLNRQ